MLRNKKVVNTLKFARDLADIVTKQWEGLVLGSEYSCPSLPNRKLLRQVLEVCYLVSLETDEGRPLKFTLCCTPLTEELFNQYFGQF